MPVDLSLIGVAVSLLAPVYGLLWGIQRKIGGFSARIDSLEDKVAEHAAKLDNLDD